MEPSIIPPMTWNENTLQMINYTRTMLLEIETAHITTENIFNNVLNEVGTGNIPENRKFLELKPQKTRSMNTLF